MILEVKDLTKSFGEVEILHGISFSVESGKALGLLGRNGAGKTTTIRVLMDVFKGNSGSITIDGKPFVAKDYRMGYLPEERGLFPKKTVIEQMMYLAMLRGDSKKDSKQNAIKWLERLGVLEYRDRKLDTLSKGNQQKVQLAQTLVCNPDIVILDEPFSGLDPVNSQILKDVIGELIADKKIVIFSSHQMSYVEEFCEDIVIINKGNVALSGELKQIKKDYGQNKLEFSANNYSLEQLEEICNKQFKDYITIDQKMKECLILKLNKQITKKEFLKKVLETDIDMERFSVYEPSLTDIFVWKAGDNE